MILPGLSVDSITKYADDVANAYSVMTEDFTIWLFSQRNELPAEYSVINMARDTAAAIRCLGLEEISLFGVSKGGMVAMTVAIQEPELVSRLILGSTAAKVNTESYQVIDYWVQLAKESKREELCLAFGEKIYPENVFEQSKDLLIENAKRAAGLSSVIHAGRNAHPAFPPIHGCPVCPAVSCKALSG